MVWGWIFKNLAPHCPYVTQPLAGRGVGRTIQTLLLSSLSREPWAAHWAQWEVWQLRRGVCGVGPLLRGFLCALSNQCQQYTCEMQSLGRPKAIGELLQLMLAWNTGLSEQQCCDAVGSSWLEYSMCPCVIYVTTAHVWS